MQECIARTLRITWANAARGQTVSQDHSTVPLRAGRLGFGGVYVRVCVEGDLNQLIGFVAIQRAPTSMISENQNQRVGLPVPVAVC